MKTLLQFTKLGLGVTFDKNVSIGIKIQQGNNLLWYSSFLITAKQQWTQLS